MKSLLSPKHGPQHSPQPIRYLALILIGLMLALVAIGVALTVAPASWADGLIRQASQGRVRLTDTDGGLWKGSGRIVLANLDSQSGAASGPKAGSDFALVSGVQIPGRCNWIVNPWPLFLARFDIRLKLEHMKETVNLTGDRHKLIGTAGAFELPQIRMDRLGSPWNTIQPNAALAIRWDSFQVEQGRVLGKAAVTVSNVASALSTVRPLGSYQIDLDSNGRSAKIGITTLNGPLKLDGQGEWTASGGLRFTAYAQAQAEQVKLQPLLSLLGKRDGDRTIIRLGAV